MVEYGTLTDFQINLLIAEHVYNRKVEPEDFDAPDVPYLYHRDERVYVFIDEPESGSWRQYDPCNNPVDAWPLILKEGISLLSVVTLAGHRSWLAKTGRCPSRGDKNPLRAAMIVFLMLKEE